MKHINWVFRTEGAKAAMKMEKIETIALTEEQIQEIDAFWNLWESKGTHDTQQPAVLNWD